MKLPSASMRGILAGVAGLGLLAATVPAAYADPPWRGDWHHDWDHHDWDHHDWDHHWHPHGWWRGHWHGPPVVYAPRPPSYYAPPPPAYYYTPPPVVY